MREILFKAKRIDNGEWVEGNLILTPEADEGYRTIIIPCYDSGIYTSNYNSNVAFEEWYQVDENTICQYTGLTDKNGNKIWENDIVEISRENGYFHLQWAEDTARFVMENYDDRFIVDFDNYWSYEVEVIGNIFDNPELLERQVEEDE